MRRPGRTAAIVVTSGLLSIGAASLAGTGVAPVAPVAVEAAATRVGGHADAGARGDAWIARLGDETLPRRPTEALLTLARRERPALTLPELTRHVALDLLLGDAAAREVGDATLFASMRVGFPPEVETRRQWLATLRELWPERIDRAWRKARLELPQAPDPRAWAALWSGSAGGGLRMDEQLDDTERVAAARYVLLRYRAFGDERAGAVTLADVWPLQNVQGRRMLRAGDLAYARAQARQWLNERFVAQWLRQDSGWSEQELAFVHRVVQARLRRIAWQRWQGLSADPHGDAPARDALAAAVTTEEIAAFYAAHRDRFQRLESVEGLRLRCADPACGDGRDLRQQPGATRLVWQLGDPRPASELDAWALDLMQAWPVGQVSPAIRHPDGGGWERVQVLAVRRGHHPADSETVRHEARQALAMERLETRWQQRQQALIAAAPLRWAPGIVPPADPFVPERLTLTGAPGHAH
ncbi:hypothetical protein CDN99_13485 [Roseateles aquatilis]|uniref:PpiC domain-containing protein n=1 Tax=Roseateles aquatilis TaxID=431061 RepID=A0A246JDR7_9BURK|nr:hypothetical protein [Roseateles aquatilis]OWQ90366.1 hypothetical protein CDN99_13485 [Roseateles aquatilis]